MKNKTDQEQIQKIIMKETDAISEFLSQALYDKFICEYKEEYEQCAEINQQIEIYCSTFANMMKLFMGTDINKTRETLQVVIEDIEYKLEKNRENILNDLLSSKS